MSADSQPGRPVDPLSPYIAPRIAEAERAFLAEVRGWLGVDEQWTLQASRTYSAGTVAPSTIAVQAPGGARVELRLHTDPAATGWRAGPLTWQVARGHDGASPLSDANLRGVVKHLGERITQGDAEQVAADGKALARLHRTWSTLWSIEDRFFRHIEYAHNGVTGLLRTGFTCNQDCHFCPEGRDWPNPSDDMVFQWLDEIAAFGARRLTICGGEPTLWRRLPELIQRAHEVHRMSVHMNSNAINLRKPELTERLRTAGLASVMISLHAVDPAISDAMTRAPGTWQRTVAGIHQALDAGITVILNCCVERTNVEHLPEHARFVREQFIEGHPDNPVRMVNYSQPGKYYDFKMYLDRLVAVDVARPLLAEVARILAPTGVLLEITGTCGFPACVAHEFTDVVPWRAKETMDAAHRAGRSDAPLACQRCAVQDQCIGPRREYLDVHGERGLVPYEVVPRSDWYERLAATLGDAWFPPTDE